jgi:hypothetical protein
MAVVDGTAQLEALALRLRAAGAGEAGAIRKALRKGLKAGAGPLIPLVKAAAADQLPKSGGLNQLVAGQRITVSTLLSVGRESVRLTTKDHDTKSTNSGYVRHPVFGHMDRWVSQSIPHAAGWWSTTLERESPKVTPELLKTLEEVAVMIQRAGL